MQKAQRLTADQRENLVAYLDGELPDDETQRIDEVLARSEVARHEVEALARTWELLDLLSKPNATGGFTDRTLTTLKVSEVSTPLSDQLWFAHVRQGLQIAVCIVVLAACAAGGYLITTKLVPNANVPLLAELPLIQNLDVYTEIQDLEFLKNVQRSALFTSRVAAVESEDSTKRTVAAAAETSQAASSLRDRYNQVAALAEPDREHLKRNWELFQRLSAEQQDHYRKLHADLQEQPESVQTVLATYAIWLQTLTPGQRSDLRRAMDSSARLDLVRQFKVAQDSNRETQMFDLNLDLRRWKPFPQFPPYLNEADLAAVLKVVTASLPPERQREIEGNSRIPIERFYLTLRVAGQINPRWMEPKLINDMIAAISEEPIRRQLQSMPAEQQRGELFKLIIKGISAVMAREFERYMPTEDQLEKIYLSLPGDRRSELAELPSHELTRALLEEHWRTIPSEELKSLLQLRNSLRDAMGVGRGPGTGQRPPWWLWDRNGENRRPGYFPRGDGERPPPGTDGTPSERGPDRGPNPDRGPGPNRGPIGDRPNP